jgi:hypothetical protein
MEQILGVFKDVLKDSYSFSSVDGTRTRANSQSNDMSILTNWAECQQGIFALLKSRFDFAIITRTSRWVCTSQKRKYIAHESIRSADSKQGQRNKNKDVRGVRGAWQNGGYGSGELAFVETVRRGVLGCLVDHLAGVSLSTATH